MKLPLWSALGALAVANHISPPLKPPVALTRKDNETILQTRLSERTTRRIRAEAVAHPDHVVPLTASNLKKYVLQAPRSYNLVIMGGADAEFCPYCGVLQEYLFQVARTSSGNEGSEGFVVDGDNYPTFFMYFDANVDQDMAARFQMTTVPEIFRITEYSLKCFDDDAKEVALQRDAHKVDRCVVHPDYWLRKDQRKNVKSTEDLEKEIYELIGLDKPSQESQGSDRRVRKIYVLVAFGLLTLGLGIHFFDLIRDLILKYPAVVATLALLSFWLSTSGIIYNLQHGMQWYGYDRRTGDRLLVARQARSQFLGEGIAFSALTIITSMGLYTSIRLKPYLYSILRNRPLAPLLRVSLSAFIVLAVLTTALCYAILEFGVKAKHPFLKPAFIPRGFVYGSVRKDRMYGM